MSLIIAAIQYCPRLAKCRADISDNFRRCESLINTASRCGAQLIVFPELCMTGYSFLSKAEVSEIAEPLDGPTFRAMRGVAQELKSYVAWGFPEFADDGNLYNSAAMVGPDGKYILGYRKINLFGNDYLWAKSGAAVSSELPPIVKTELGNVSMVICRDIRDKYPINVPRIAAKKEPPMFEGRKVDIVVAPANWGKGGFPSNTWMNFAADNQCTLVVANRWGNEVNQSEEHGIFEQDFHQGGSAIITKDWNVNINGLKFSQDCIVVSVV